MYKWMLAAGAAALAITSPVLAERGGQREGKGQSAQKEERGGGQAKARGGGSRQAKADRGGNRQVRTERAAVTGRFAPSVPAQTGRPRPIAAAIVRVASRSDSRNVMIGTAAAGATMQELKLGAVTALGAARGRRQSGSRSWARQRADGARSTAMQIRGNGKARFATVDGNDIVRVRDIDRRGVVRVRDIDRDDLFVRRLGYGVGGCPPGLAKKPVACLPPGQAAKLVGQPLFAATRIRGARSAAPLVQQPLLGRRRLLLSLRRQAISIASIATTT